MNEVGLGIRVWGWRLRNVRRGPRRCGALYVAVMGVTMIIGMIALASVTVGRLQLRRVVAQGEQREAQMLARSGVEWGVNYISTTPTWREIVVNGFEFPERSFGLGTMSWSASDVDGDMNDGDSDPVTIRGIGRVGDVIAVEEVTVANNGPALDCLEVALCCSNDIALPAGSTFSWRHIYGDQMVSSNGNIDATQSYADVKCDAWATGNITGTVDGTALANQSPARELPDSSVFDYYTSAGTTISITSLPVSGSFRVIDKRVLSPNSNPFGATNSEGIYVIDCGGANIRIGQSRIVGTLVLLNNGVDTETANNPLCWEPAVAGYPSLLVQNDLTFKHNGSLFSENLRSVNLNPPGTPFDGVENTDQSDTHPTRFWGIVYVGGRLKVDSGTGGKNTGVVICNSFVSNSSHTFNYDSTPLLNAPPGFRGSGEMAIQRGTWRRVAY